MSTRTHRYALFVIFAAVALIAPVASAAEGATDEKADLLARLEAARAELRQENSASPALPPMVTAAAFTSSAPALTDELFDPMDILEDPQTFAERFPESATALPLPGTGPSLASHGCAESDDGYHSLGYRSSIIDTYSYLYVHWSPNPTYGCADSTHPSGDKYWHNGNGDTGWWGSDPYYADEVAIAVELKAPGWGVESLSISASDVGLTLSSSSNDYKLFEGVREDLYYWNFAYSNQYVDVGAVGQVWNVEQKVSGTFTFIYGGVAETRSTSTYATVDV